MLNGDDITVGLTKIEIEIDPETTVGEDELFYSLGITKPERLGGNYYFSARLSCGRHVKEMSTKISVQIEYGGAFNSANNDAVMEKAIVVAKYAIWSKFTSLFSVISTQIGIDFPALPQNPGDVEILDVDDGTSEVEAPD
ncbi:hypothetical protein FJV80_24710 [Mesorhizobium sp. WSM4310]|uniref:hypothetical protein n=1 Tax=Mesorhizobium sp. WSM4310 TaxID=2589883 RepID=UPI00115C598C|nr:hypothetical protein [Mesorhizobium sp. WSM4310]TRC78546.1 hypothetical protein FJV80_24710 [Mesorhizobium sp. WSM4310]